MSFGVSVCLSVTFFQNDRALELVGRTTLFVIRANEDSFLFSVSVVTVVTNFCPFCSFAKWQT